MGPTRSFRLRRNPAKGGGQAHFLECSCLAQEFGAPEPMMFGHLGNVKSGETGIRTQEGLVGPTRSPGVLLRPTRTSLR